MTVFVLINNLDYPKGCYFLEKYKTRFEAVEAIKEKAYLPSDYTFIEGNELILTLMEGENSDYRV